MKEPCKRYKHTLEPTRWVKVVRKEEYVMVKKKTQMSRYTCSRYYLFLMHCCLMTISVENTLMMLYLGKEIVLVPGKRMSTSKRVCPRVVGYPSNITR